MSQGESNLQSLLRVASEVPVGPRRSGQTEWESNNRSSTRVKFECLESRWWCTNFRRIPRRWSREREKVLDPSFSVSPIREAGSFKSVWPIKHLQSHLREQVESWKIKICFWTTSRVFRRDSKLISSFGNNNTRIKSFGQKTERGNHGNFFLLTRIF